MDEGDDNDEEHDGTEQDVDAEPLPPPTTPTPPAAPARPISSMAAEATGDGVDMAA